MSAFQSILDSGAECGNATNPILDLARQLASTTPNDVTNVDELNALNQQTQQQITNDAIDPTAINLNSTATDSLFQNERSRFDMDNLLDEVNSIIQADLAQTELPKSQERPSIPKDVFQTDNDPLIANFPPNVEENFWKEVSNDWSKDIVDHFTTGNDLNLPNLDWANDYLNKLDLNDTNNNLDDGDLLDDSTQQHSAYRNQQIENVSLFSSTAMQMPFTRPFSEKINNEQSNEAISDANLKDQEMRLIDMMLGNNGSTQEQNNQKDSPITSEENQQQEQVPEEANKERFFYENQFDDMDFWMKLAEEWHSSDGTPSKQLTDDAKIVQIREPLQNLLEENHTNYYKFIDDNPFIETEPSNETESETKNIEIDYVKEGLNRMKLGDLSAAVLMFEAAAQQKPDDAEIWKLLGIANAKNENDQKAIAALKRCLASNPTNETDLEALMYLATCFTNESLTTEACYALQEWLKQHPKYKDCVQDPIEVQIDETKKRGPNSISFRWANKKNVFADGFFDSVKQGFLNAAQKQPNDPDTDVQCGLGVLLNLSGEYEKAIECFKVAVEKRPEDYSLWNRYGASLANGGHAEESMQAYRQALELFPGYIRARYNLAISCIMLGTGQQAAEHLLEVLNLQTSGADSVKGLISLNRDNITSNNVWNLMRSALEMEGKTYLLAKW